MERLPTTRGSRASRHSRHLIVAVQGKTTFGECSKGVFVRTQCKRARALYESEKTKSHFCIICYHANVQYDNVRCDHARCDHARWVLKLVLLYITKQIQSKMETCPVICREIIAEDTDSQEVLFFFFFRQGACLTEWLHRLCASVHKDSHAV